MEERLKLAKERARQSPNPQTMYCAKCDVEIVQMRVEYVRWYGDEVIVPGDYCPDAFLRCGECGQDWDLHDVPEAIEEGAIKLQGCPD